MFFNIINDHHLHVLGVEVLRAYNVQPVIIVLVGEEFVLLL